MEPEKRPQVLQAIYTLLTAEPFTGTIKLNSNDHLCLIGSDGFWDAMSDDMVLEICSHMRESTVDKICSALLERARDKRSHLQVQDDITIVAIDLRHVPNRIGGRSVHESDEKFVEAEGQSNSNDDDDNDNSNNTERFGDDLELTIYTSDSRENVLCSGEFKSYDEALVLSVAKLGEVLNAEQNVSSFKLCPVPGRNKGEMFLKPAK